MTDKYLYLLFSLFLCFKSHAQKPFYGLSEKEWQKNNIQDSSKLMYSVFLVGDAGYLSPKKGSIVLNILQNDVSASNKDDVLIFLGDNVYPSPMERNRSKSDSKKEAILLEQLKVANKFKGKTFFISGNLDWKKGNAGILNEQLFVDAYQKHSAFFPRNSNSIVEKVDLNTDLSIIFIHSELLLDKHKTFPSERQDAYTEIEKMINQNSKRNILIAQHHPIYSTGVHSGFFSLKDHIFPLTNINRNLYLPLPIVGSLYPVIRQYGVSKQDLNNPQYQHMKKSLVNIVKDKKNIIIASGHEHALQLIKDADINQIISGGGSVNRKVFNVEPALFGIGSLGYAKLNYYENGQCWVEFYIPDENKNGGTLIYKKPLYGLQGDKSDIAEEKAIDYKDSTKLVAAGSEYASSRKKEKTFGKQYRKSWTTPVRLPYLDLTREKGGLSVISSTDSALILQDKNANEYTFRLINSNPHDLLPKGFDATIVEDIIRDQTSTSQPYGAVIVDYLAQKAGLPALGSQIFYLPYTRLLKENLSGFGGHIGILERKIKTDKLIDTDTLYHKLDNHPHVKVDQKEYVKTRLFDLLIGDYHRDENTWLWQANTKGSATIYTPISKNRKQFFTKIDGYVPSFLKKLVPEIQTFDYSIKKPEKLAISARNLDRNLLNELSEEEWLKTANYLKNNLDDQTIKMAVKQLPKESYEIDGIELEEKLIARKNNLTETAKKYYRTLSKDVKIVATNQSDKIVVKRNGDSTSVSLTSFGRIFVNKDTRQLQIYSLDGNDSLFVSGISKSPIKLRYVGGDGIDYVENKSKNKKLFVYDNYKSEIQNAQPARLILTDEKWVNDFSRNDFIYNRSGFSPNAMIYNATDFVSIGISHQIRNRGFRKEPYSFEQKVGALVAPKTGALELKYLSTFYSLFSNNIDLVLTGRYIGPAYDFNFYGNGNSSDNLNDLKYYQVRSKNAKFNTFLQKRVSDKITFGLGPGMSYFHILKQKEYHFLNEYAVKNPSTDWFLNFSSYLNFDFSDNIFYPKNGWRWTNSISYSSQISNNKYQHVNLKTDFRTYYTPSVNIPFTFALRVGASTNIGDYNFYQANTLGNLTNLRGYRADRYSGRSTIYSNLEGRLKLTKIRSYFLAGDIGLFGFYDTGRVFSNNLETSKWHSGYGPGVWINFFDNLLVSLGYGISSEDKVFSLNIGFRF
ncbi:BamA/TamA family outer membrane protein [Pseudopedobacter sp.]|uniref:BamA/TamA family outer membrane protein n=1 Tax=Pseudopedobacter sp. TaxID=1936787 RepID=UPI003340AE2A